MVGDQGGQLLLETRGLERLGLPELRLRSAPRSHLDAAIALVNASAQRLLEQGALDRTGELTVDIGQARTPHLRELAASARARGGARPVVLLATWEAAYPEGSVDPGAEPPPPRIRLEVPRGEAASHEEAFVIALARVFGDADERLA